MPNILIRNFPATSLKYAKKLAQQSGHSLQEEIRTILLNALKWKSGDWSKQADRIRRRLEKEGRHFSDSVKLIREDRKR